MSERGFFTRVGAALLSPRQNAEALCRGERGGLRDVLYLLPLRLLVGEMALLVASDGRSLLLAVLGALSVDLLGIFFGGVLMALLIGRRERNLPASLTTDLAAQGWFAWLAVQVTAALGFVLAQSEPGPTLLRAIQIAGAGLWGVYFLIGLLVARKAAVAAEEAQSAGATPPSPSAAPPAASPSALRRWRLCGGLFIAALLCLASYDIAWLARQKGHRPQAGGAPEVVVPQFEPAAPGGGRVGDTSEFRLSAERGHPVLIDFWATWCVPCKQSLPILDKVYERLQPRGLRAIAIDTGDDEAQVRAFAARLGLHLPIGLDTGEAAGRYGVTTIPHLVLVGSDGAVKRVFHGVHSGEEIEQAVLSLGF
jgi:thiol-disulfide isomerase/thioredoxin